MAVYKCKMCGGALKVDENNKVGVCPYCNTKQDIVTYDDEKLINIFERADKLRLECEFDKASVLYETILTIKPLAEAYWGLLLCNYGIEYVDDDKTGYKVITCHRTNYESVLESNEYLNAIKYADVINKETYQEDAKKIDQIQKGILQVSMNVEPYDIFICYKESDGYNSHTKDSVLAYDIYQELIKQGYKVFFSRITLENKIGINYEPYIFAALKSSKVMILVTTSKEHSESIWVKNEWSRYLKQMEKDNSKHLITCYQDITPKDLPSELSYIQGLDMSKIGAMQDLIHGVSKLISPCIKSYQSLQNSKTYSAPKTKTNSLDYDYQKAKEYILNPNPYMITANGLEKHIENLSLMPDYKDSKMLIKNAKMLYFKKICTSDMAITAAHYLKEDETLDPDGSISKHIIEVYSRYKKETLALQGYMLKKINVFSLGDFNYVLKNFISCKRQDKTLLNSIDLDIIAKNEAESIKQLASIMPNVISKCNDKNMLNTTKEYLNQLNDLGVVLSSKESQDKSIDEQLKIIDDQIAKVKRKMLIRKIIIASAIIIPILAIILSIVISNAVKNASYRSSHFNFEITEKINQVDHSDDMWSLDPSYGYEYLLKMDVTTTSKARAQSLTIKMQIKNRNDKILFSGNSMNLNGAFEKDETSKWDITLTARPSVETKELWNTNLDNLKIFVKIEKADFIGEWNYKYDEDYRLVHDVK